MKELISQQQANEIVMGLSFLATLASLAWGLYRSGQLSGRPRKSLWANVLLFALVGPAIWIFWGVYNSIENEYGLDSLKALEINFWIVIAIACFFMAIHWFIHRWMSKTLPKHHRS